LGCGAVVFGVDALCFFKLVFEDDDAAGGLDRSALVDEFTRAGCDPQLVAGVAAVAALGAERGDQAGFAKGAEEARGGAEHLGGPAHRVGGIVVVIEAAERVVCCHCTSLWNAWRGPGAMWHQDPEGTATPSAGPHAAPAFCVRTAARHVAGGAGIAVA